MTDMIVVGSAKVTVFGKGQANWQ